MPNKGYKQTPEHAEKNRLARLGNKPSEETKRKMREAKLGEKNHNYGKTFSQETCDKISAATMGRGKGVPRPEHVRKAIGDAHRGDRSHTYGKPLPEDVKEKIRIATSGERNHNYKRVFSDDTKDKIAASRLGTIIPTDVRIRMSASHQGISEEDWERFAATGNYCHKWTDPRLKIRKRVRARFDNKCIACGKTNIENGQHLSVHHVTRNKTACCEGEAIDWLFATLCKTCHSRYGHTPEFEEKLRDIISTKYSNKCMLSLNEYNSLYQDGSDSDKLWGRRSGY